MSREITHEDGDTKQSVEMLLESNRLTHEKWEAALEDGSLVGLECEECEYVTATPNAACVRCGGRSVSPVRLPEQGSVYSKTTIEVAPDAQGSGYQIALVDVGDARVLGRITDGERVDIDDEVELSGPYEYDDDLAPLFEPI